MCGVILIGKVGQADIDAAALSQAGFIPGAIDIEGDVVSAGGLRRGFKGHVLCREGHVIAVHHSDDPGTILGVVIDNDREVLQCEGGIVVDKVEGHLSIDADGGLRFPVAEDGDMLPILKGDAVNGVLAGGQRNDGVLRRGYSLQGLGEGVVRCTVHGNGVVNRRNCEVCHRDRIVGGREGRIFILRQAGIVPLVRAVPRQGGIIPFVRAAPGQGGIVPLVRAVPGKRIVPAASGVPQIGVLLHLPRGLTAGVRTVSQCCDREQRQCHGHRHHDGQKPFFHT